MKPLVILSLALSLCAVCLSACCVYRSEYAYVSLFISILSILVTCLVGWQIYAAFVTRSEMMSFRKDFDAVKSSVSGQVSETERFIIDVCRKNFNELSKEMCRNIDALGSCIVIRMNHGVGETLLYVADNAKIEGDYSGFLRKLLAEVAEGAVSDIVAAYLREGDGAMLRECIEALPHHKLCNLYSLDFAAAGWSDERVLQFKRWLDIVSSLYPKPFNDKNGREGKHGEQGGNDNQNG